MPFEMKAFSPADVAAILQALVAIVAIVAAPTTLSYLFTHFFRNYEAWCRPRLAEGFEETRTWDIEVRCLNNRLGQGKISIFPTLPGNAIAHVHPLTHPDGGLQYSAAVDHGGATIDIARMAPRRTFMIRVIFCRPDVPGFAADSKITRQLLPPLAKSSGGRELALATSQVRLMVLLVQFSAAMVLVVGRIIYLGLTN